MLQLADRFTKSTYCKRKELDMRRIGTVVPQREIHLCELEWTSRESRRAKVVNRHRWGARWSQRLTTRSPMEMIVQRKGHEEAPCSNDGVQSMKSKPSVPLDGRWLLRIARLGRDCLVAQRDRRDGLVRRLQLTACWSFLLFWTADARGAIAALSVRLLAPLGRRGRDLAWPTLRR